MFHHIKSIKDRIHTRWELRRVKCGKDTLVFGHINITSRRDLKIGSNCRINNNVLLNSSYGIVLGNNVTLSSNCSLISNSLDLKEWKIGNRLHCGKRITIGDDVWVCAGAVILPGVTISGKNVVVGAGSVLTHDITENNCVYAGNPAKLIKTL